eukprot:Lankesteria_metandrocarpae@DN2287_c0_g1_i1.p1
MASSSILLAVTFRPFAIPAEYEERVPRVDLCRGAAGVPATVVEDGPPRCRRCLAYVNGGIRRHDSAALCNICHSYLQFPLFYSELMLESDRSRDVYSDPTFDRPELVRGTIDYVAPQSLVNSAVATTSATATVAPPLTREGISDALLAKTQSLSAAVPTPPECWSVPVRPGFGTLNAKTPAFCVVLEATYLAVKQGVTACVLKALRNLLMDMHATATLSLVLFDHHLHFYPFYERLNSSNGAEQTPDFIVSDVNDPFPPLPVDILSVNVQTRITDVSRVLDDLVLLYSAEPSPSRMHSNSAAHAAMQAAMQILAVQGGGTIVAYCCTAPNRGLGSWDRNEPGVDKNARDSELLKPRSSVRKFLEDAERFCAAHGVAVDLFCMPPSSDHHLDLATLATLPRVTGGNIHYNPNFTHGDFEQLYRDLFRVFNSEFGLDCHVKLRCGRGVAVKQALVPWCGRCGGADQSSFHVSKMGCDTAVTFLLQHDDNIGDSDSVAMQLAVLHRSSITGEVIVRTVNVTIPVTNSIATTFRSADIDTTMNLLAKRAAMSFLMDGGCSNTTWRDDLINTAVDILFAYRANCAMNSLPDQLILPDSLKLIPIYCNALFKNSAFRAVRDARNDERIALLLSLLRHTVEMSGPALHPRLYCVHRSHSALKGDRFRKLGEDLGLDGHFVIPHTVPCSGGAVTTDGVYLMDTGYMLLFYAGCDVDEDYLESVIGVRKLVTESVGRAWLDEGRSRNSELISNAVKQIRRERSNRPWLPLKFVPLRSLEESTFIWYLVEDKLGSEPNYVDFLCQLHKSVRDRLLGE